MCPCIHSDNAVSFTSREFLDFLHKFGISVSRTSVGLYNPRGNGQTERYNGMVWSAVTAALKSRNLPVTQWETVLPDALHSVRSLLCTSTNATPHERMFAFSRHSSIGLSVPTWLSNPGPVLLKRHVKTSKYEPLVDEVELVHATPSYAHVRLQDGRETTTFFERHCPCRTRP